MRYIIVEDGESGYDFWLVVNTVLLGNGYKVVKADGNANVCNKVKEVARKDDFLAILLDSVDDGFVDFHRKITQYCMSENINVSILPVNCFEETLLSFKLFLQWVYVDPREQNRIAMLKEVMDSIDSGVDYFDKDGLIRRYADQRGWKNRARFAKNFLNELTKETGFSFTNNKLVNDRENIFINGRFNSENCWLCSCCPHSNRQGIRKCGLSYSNLSMLHKFDELKSYSLFGTQLSTLQ